MGEKFLGVPLALWGIACLALSVVWGIYWPSDKAVPDGTIRFLVLRWGHTLVWALLALSAFVAGYGLFGGAQTARVLALLSLGVYLVFMATLVTAG